MSKKADTWMPLYVGEYLADTTNLNTEQHGAYCLMLMAAWKRGGKLPNDDRQLASITKLSPAKWRAHRQVLVEFFQAVDDDSMLSHKRVTQEREKAQKISESKSQNGTQGAAKRWQNGGDLNGETVGEPIANAMANQWRTDAPSPIPKHSPSERKEEADASLSPPSAPDDRDGFALESDLGRSPPGTPDCPQRKLIDLYRQKLPGLPKPRPELWEGSAGSRAMRQRWRWLLTARRENGQRYASTEAEGLEWFSAFFTRCAQSDFLTGRSGKWTNCNLAWLMNREKFTAVIDGVYDNKESA